jgi:hypothetical protein
MTIADATKWCAQNPACAGFTTKNSSAGPGGLGCPGAPGIHKVYFKAQAGQHPNIDKTWVSYGKATKPCSVMSTLEHWSQPPNVKLGPEGKTIVLGGMAGPGKVAAVRMNWRSYPCEHLSCGVYSAAENLPPAPFWAEVLQ